MNEFILSLIALIVASAFYIFTEKVGESSLSNISGEICEKHDGISFNDICFNKGAFNREWAIEISNINQDTNE